jgi:diacylglycerol kinase (ATP)
VLSLDLLTSRREYIESDQIAYRQARQIEIKSEPCLLFSIDGDLVEQQPVKFHARPKSIRVIAERGK